MSFAAGNAARGAATLSLGQLAAVGITAYAVANPEKFLEGLMKGLHVLQTNSNQQQQGSGMAPIIIHQTAPGANGKSMGVYMVQMAVGAGLCGWGSYMILVQILPEQAKQFLPVSTKTFNKAVASLGKAVINLKDTLLVQIQSLSNKQDELGEQQEETHTQVLEVKGNVQNVRTDLSLVQEALNLCQESLSESERRTSYIARGVQLLTRGVSTILPEDEGLLHELVSFNSAGEDMLKIPSPMQNHRLQKTMQALSEIPKTDVKQNKINSTAPSKTVDQASPENEHPPNPASDAVSDVYSLLHSIGCPQTVQ